MIQKGGEGDGKKKEGANIRGVKGAKCCLKEAGNFYTKLGLTFIDSLSNNYEIAILY